MTSSVISRTSAAILSIAGLALLFASDMILPRLVPGLPPDAAWLGQILGAAWLALANLNWFNRSTILGGIHGRPVVAANLALYLISALVFIKAAVRAEPSAALWTVAVVAAALALGYAALLFWGPLRRDLSIYGGD